LHWFIGLHDRCLYRDQPSSVAGLDDPGEHSDHSDQLSSAPFNGKIGFASDEP